MREFFKGVLSERIQAKTVPTTGESAHFLAKPAESSVLADLGSIELQNFFKTTSAAGAIETQTRDAGSVMYINGLPTLVIADGETDANSEPPHLLCNTFLPAMLPSYVKRLTDGEAPFTVMQALLTAVNTKAHELQKTYQVNFGAAFTFSCAICYQHNDELKVAAIGVGSDMLLIYRRDSYLSLRAAVKTCDTDELADILNGKSARPHLTQTLPSHDIDQIIHDNPVSTFTLEANDQLLALSDGVFSFLQVDIESCPSHKNIALIKHRLACDTITPENLFAYQATIAEQFFDDNKTRPGFCIGDDALIIRASVPSDTQRLAINAQALLDYQARFIAYQTHLCQTLKREYPYLPRLFGRHHNDRREAVCQAIERASGFNDVQKILSNQQAIFTLSASAVASLPDALERRWSDPSQLVHPPSSDSLYKKAIDATQTDNEDTLTSNRFGI